MRFLHISRNQVIALAIVSLAVLAAFAIFLYPKLVSGPLSKPPAPQESNVVAVVNGEEIMRGTFEARAVADEYFYTVISPLPEEERGNIRNQTLEGMIQEKLLTQVLGEQRIVVTDDEIRQRIQEITVDPRFHGDWDAYEAEIERTYRSTLHEVMRTMRIMILREKVAALTNQKHVFAIWVEKNQPQTLAYESMTPEQRAELEDLNRTKREKIEAALQRIQAGEYFAAVAREVSEHPPTAQNGGDLGMLAPPTDTPFLAP